MPTEVLRYLVLEVEGESEVCDEQSYREFLESKAMDNCANQVTNRRNYPFHELRQLCDQISAIHDTSENPTEYFYGQVDREKDKRPVKYLLIIHGSPPRSILMNQSITAMSKMSIAHSKGSIFRIQLDNQKSI